MLPSASRILAIVCAAAALLCVAAWLAAGAPNVPHINLLTDPSVDDSFRNGNQSVSWQVIWGLASVSLFASHLVLMMISASVGTAAVLSLVLLARRDRSEATVHLGVGLGWWALSIAYLGLFITTTPFMFYDRWSFPIRVALDMVAFLFLYASTREVVTFWENFPYPVSEVDLASFRLAARLRRSWQPWALARWSSDAPVWGPIRECARRFHLTTAAAILLVSSLGFLWRGGWYLPLDRLSDFSSDLVQWLFAAAIFGAAAVLGWPVFRSLQLLQFHRRVGSPEDRKRIEWIWMDIWIAVILVLLPIAVVPAMYLAEYWFPELAFDSGWIGLYLLLAITTAPFIVIVSLALSVFYRGAVDPRLALKGFTVWTLLGVVLTLIFVFIERMVATRVVLWMHLPPQTGYVTAGAIVAATFQPIRKRVEKGVNRFVERVLPETLLAAGKRSTAAVAVVDLAGFTALSARDEQSALLASALVQKEARRLADAHDGRVVKSTGDGVILVFTEAAACLAAVAELHRAVAVRAGALDLPALALHSGINWGEVVEMHDGDIYGMTVNVAARIADWAKAGEIGVSRGFHEQLAPATRGFQDAGPQSFKNVPEPVDCLRLAGV